MAFNGSGLFVRIYNWVADRNANIKIRADRMDAEMDGMADGLSNCITRDGQSTVTQPIPFNDKRLTGVGDATDVADAVNLRSANARYLSNVGISAAVGSNALTITLTDATGSTPTATAPVVIPFRSATASTGTIVNREVSSSLALVVSSGSTLGTVNSTPFSLYVVAFDDAGTIRLGVIQPVSTTSDTRPASKGIASATSEGGSGGADSAQVYYAGAAVTAKAYQVLARLDWTSGLATAGAWSAAPSVIDVSSEAGATGDYVESVIPVGSAVTLSGSTGNPTSISLPAGEWDVNLNATFSVNAATTVTSLNVGISTTASTFDTSNGRFASIYYGGATVGATIVPTLHIAPVKLVLTSTTTVYFCASSSFAGPSVAAYGVIRARRIR